MVSVFLLVVAGLSFLWGAWLFYRTGSAGEISTENLQVMLFFWGIAAVSFGCAAVLDGIRTATRKLFKKLDELAR